MAGKGLAVLTFLIGAVVLATIVGICAAFVMAHLRGVPTGSWTSGEGMAELGIALGDLAISTCGFAIVGMILGVLLRSSVIAIGAGLALLLPIETILTDAIPGTVALAARPAARVHRPRGVLRRAVRGCAHHRVGLSGRTGCHHDAGVRPPGRDGLRSAEVGQD